MSAPIYGGFAEAQLLELLHRACDIAGLDPVGAEILRGQTNAVILLPVSSVIVKVARAGTDLAEVERTVCFVRWLMDMGFPTVPLHAPDAQPLVLDCHPVTLWAFLPQPPEPILASTLAKPLSILHSLSDPPVSLPRADAVGAIRASLRQAAVVLPEEDLRFLEQRVDRLERELADVRYVLPPETILQGDPHHKNALHSTDGVVLCDWDSVTVGHPEWDLVTIEIHCRRFGYGVDDYRDFAAAYGWDITAWDGYPVLRDLRELRMISTNARKSTHTPDKAAEVLRRIAGLRREDHAFQWNIL
ncbi:phosphotransferase [Nonomuraea lactucae]|uniref:phosphotransferase n=1 Tax=Nonomuraea lactucae TaxID=2249762 RepID=UPI000DE2D735|nr:phosphotransferase [Nonomuraea lactucae]